MRVALVVPESCLGLAHNTPPFNLGYLASYLRQEIQGIKIKIIDGLICHDVDNEIFLFQPNIVGITCTTPQANDAYALADRLHRLRPDIKVVLGGVHPSVLPEEALGHADCVVVGEGESALVNIVQNLESASGIIKGQPILNLDEIPMPAYDLMDMKTYIRLGTSGFPRAWKVHLHSPVFGVMTSRGCPYRCAFCYNSYRSTRPRWFSAKRVVEEIEYLVQEYGAKNFFFNDDEFLINKKRLRELSELFKAYGLNKRIVWGCQARVESLDRETVELVMGMGCVLLSSGFENATPRILNFLKRGVTVAKNEKAIQACDVYGMTYGGGFVFGSPTETLAEMKQTVKWFERQEGITWIGVNTLIPYPGTEVWRVCMAKGLLPAKVDYDKLIPSADPSKTYCVSAVPTKVYNRFMLDTYYLTWIITQSRLIPSFTYFVKLMKQKTWWYVLLVHPLKMLRIIRTVTRRRSLYTQTR